MSAATVCRTGIGCAELLARRAPALMQLNLQTQGGSTDVAAAQARFRDELIALARDSSELALREIRRGIEDLDSFTRPEESADEVTERRFYKAKP